MVHPRQFFPALFCLLILGGEVLAESEPGRLLDEFAVQRWQVEEGLPEDSVRGLLFAPDGYLWCLTDKTLSRFDGVRFALLKGSVSGPDIFHSEQEQFGSEVVQKSGGVSYLSTGRDGVEWAATATNLLCRLRGKWQEVPLPPHRSHPRWRITALRAFDSADVWVGTTSGLWRLKEGVWFALSPRDGFYPLEVRSITRDTEGNVWVGSSGGLLRLRRKMVQVYDSGLVLERHTFTAILPDSGMKLRVGVAGGGLLEGVPGAFRPSSVAPVSRTAVISALLKSKDGALWIGTQGDYLWRCLSGRADCISDPAPGDNSAVDINALLEDRRGRLWVGTGSGLMSFNSRSNRLETVAGLPPGGRIHALIEARDGAVWAGMQGDGVVRVSTNGQIEIFGREQGLPSSTVLALCQDGDGMVWAGTTDGLGCWDGVKWSAITERQGVPEGPLSQLLAEGAYLWVGSRNGITRLSRAELSEVAAGRAGGLNPQPFGINEGMREEQCASGFGNLAAKDDKGRLWFSTLNGLVMIDPARAGEKPAGGLRGYIDEVRMPERVVSLVKRTRHGPVSLIIRPGTERISIRYSAPFFTSPDLVQFKYLLEGYDTVWSAPTTSRSAGYTRLPPGTYRFRLMAGVGGAWRESIQTVDLIVQPFLWQQRWVWVIAGSLALALVGLLAREAEKRRSRRRFLELERQGALERERARIAHDLHDDLGAALTEIGLLSAVAQRPAVTPERARHYLGEIGEKIRRMVDTLDEIVWAINPRNDTVTSLGDYFCECAQRMLKLTPIRCRLDLAPDLPDHPLDPDRRHNLFLAFNEALNNVIRHSGAEEALIRIAGERGQLVVEVGDNGRGLGREPVSEGAEGLKSMRRRLERMGGRCEVGGRDGGGTTVRFIVPLE